jgi:hypothetical protein
MKEFIDLNYCSVQLVICKPINECRNKAILYIEDENAVSRNLQCTENSK